MELERQLVRALEPLALDGVPESAITCLFDTGGTASVREEWAETVSRRQLRAVDRIFVKYLRLYETASRQPAAVDPQVVHFWPFFASQEALETVIPHQETALNHEALYRSFLTVLQAIINIREVYASSQNDADKRRLLVKALVASKIYLTWLQLPGGSAYGLFMPYLYRQVLDLLKKWSALIGAKEAGKSTEIQTNHPRARKSRRRGKRKDPSSDEASDDEHEVTYPMVTRLGFEVLDLFLAFLNTFSLSCSEESIVPTIETAIALQTAKVPETEGTASSLTAKTMQIVEALMNGTHGNRLQLAKVILHCYLPGVTFQESVAKENRSGLRFHRLSIEVITRMQHLAATSCQAEDDAQESGRRDYSLMVLGLVQHICLHAPGLADERQRVLSYLFSTIVAGRREKPEHDDDEEEEAHASAFRDEECVRFVRFLVSYSRNAKLKYRQFAVELLSRLIVDARCWHVKENEIPEALRPYAGIKPLLEVLIDRACDKMAQVRTKAIAGISAMLTRGLSTLASQETDDEDEGRTRSGGSADAIANSLPTLLYKVSRHGSEDERTLEETPLLQRLVSLFRERLVDEKTFVRRAAVQALEALLMAQSGDTLDKYTTCDLVAIHSRCADTSVVVRVQAIKSLSALVLKFPRDPEAQKLWNLGVLPLCIDPETSVQSCALEATGNVVFHRLLTWSTRSSNPSQREALDCVWRQVSHLDGVLARCVQKAMRLLLKSEKLDARKLIPVCVRAITESVRCCSSEKAMETAPGDLQELWTSYWGFSWILLEELAHSGKLIQAVKGKHENVDIVVECWTKLQEEALPVALNDGSKRILRVLAAISPVLDAQDAKVIADGILTSLHAFAIPLNVIRDAIFALHSMCQAKAPSVAKGRELSFMWGTKLLEVCETNLRPCFEGGLERPERLEEETAWVQKQLITIGEVALLEFEQETEKATGTAALLPVTSSLYSLVQLFLPPKVVPTTKSPLDTLSSRQHHQAPVAIPTPVRICAFVTLGKLCLRDSELAKDCMTLFIRELRTCAEPAIRSNLLLILADLCIRYTSLVDVYMSTIALSLVDPSRLVRRSALLVFSQLLLQDYLKWRDSLQRFFFRVVVDEDDEIATLARQVLNGPLRQKVPYLFTNKLIEMLFVLNGVAKLKLQFTDPVEEEGTHLLALAGPQAARRRAQVYTFFLDHMTDEQKVQMSMKLCTEVLEEVMDGTLALSANPSDLSVHHGTTVEAVLQDALGILMSRELQVRGGRDEHEMDEGEDDEESGTVSVAARLAAAKGKLVSKLSKKTFLENIVPVVIGLKHTLEAKRSPLTRDLLVYMRELLKVYRDEVKEIFVARDPQLAMELEYDVRQLERQQHEQRLENESEGFREEQGDREGGNASSTTLIFAPATVEKAAHGRRRARENEVGNKERARAWHADDDDDVAALSAGNTRRKRPRKRSRTNEEQDGGRAAAKEGLNAGLEAQAHDQTDDEAVHRVALKKKTKMMNKKKTKGSNDALDSRSKRRHHCM